MLNPSDPSILDNLIAALAPKKPDKPEPRGGKGRAAKNSPRIQPEVRHADDLDVVIGVMGPQTPEGIALTVDQVFSISSEWLAPKGMEFLSQLADNHGMTDDDRAYNFLLARYPPPPLSQDQGFELSGVSVGASRLGAGAGRIVRAIYRFRNDNGAEKKFFVRVDVTHKFPMIVSPWQEFLERGDAS